MRSRAARRAAEPADVADVADEPKQDTKVRIAEEIALKEARESGAKKIPLDELTAISMGVHPELQKPEKAAGRIVKSSRKNKRDKKKRAKGEAIKEMLSEKISASKERHTTVRSYRTGE